MWPMSLWDADLEGLAGQQPYDRFHGIGRLVVADSLNSLAALYQSQGRYADAEPLYKRASLIAEKLIAEKAIGPDHPAIATLLSNLAELYLAQGRYAEAEPLYKRSLAIQEKAVGPDHAARYERRSLLITANHPFGE
jgi:tetratricopeptide (TPR) repeat protein